ncbi:hypothetical protein LVJ82_17340 [Vitreoscilla massiliensis]|uniref:Phage tail lysozyme domain-containing protein n=1 Tax=Vitreoscilla massiliensis TaxID=1689272 RepID=A0ABY4E0B5_9NEIS|nr:hypothetical protein [Vitreoscilla massiliensis]UOO89185.1 hypothetical protein LVJ82_17340 [Vitreoscilla massiliensis]
MANSISLSHDDNGFLVGKKFDRSQFDLKLKETLTNTKAILKKLDGRRIGNRILVSGHIAVDGDVKQSSQVAPKRRVVTSPPPSAQKASSTGHGGNKNTTKRIVLGQKPIAKPVMPMIVSSHKGVTVKGRKSQSSASNIGKEAMDARAAKQLALRQERAQQKISLDDAKEQRTQTDLLETIAKNIGKGGGKDSGGLLSKLLPSIPFLSKIPKMLGGGLIGGLFKFGKKLIPGLGSPNKVSRLGGYAKSFSESKFGKMVGLSKGGFLSGLIGGKGGTGLLGKLGKVKGLGVLGLGLTALESANVENSEMDRGDKNKQHLKNGVSLAGALTGGAAGMKVGAVVGSIIPGAGTGVGAILGGIVGSLAGAGVADYAMDALDDAIDPKLSKKMLGSWDGFVSTAKQGMSTLWKEMPKPIQDAGNYVAEKYEKAQKVITTVKEGVADSVGTVAGGVRNNVNDSAVGKAVNNAVEGAKKLVGIGGGGQSAEKLEGKLISSGLLANNGTKVNKKLLRKNVPESVSGGLAHAGTYAAAIDSIDSDVQKFTAFQDSYHINANAGSYHNKGLAFDVTYKNAKGGSGIATINNVNAKRFQPKADAIKARMKAAGLKEGTDFKVTNEYDPKNRVGHSTGGHIHVEIRNKEAAAKYAAFNSGKNSAEKVDGNIGLIPQDSQLQRNNDAARRGGSPSSYVPSTVGLIPQDSQLQKNNDAARRSGNSVYVPSTVNMVSGASASKSNSTNYEFSFGADVDNYIKEASKKYGIDEETLRGFIKMEAGWTGKMSPTGAIGTGQFIKSTWNSLANRKDGQEIGMTEINSSNFRKKNDPRYNKKVNTLATGLLASDNAKILVKAGLPVTGENLYMLHNIGPGVIPALKGSDNISKSTRLAMKNNGMKENESPVQFTRRQKNIFQSHFTTANKLKNTQERKPVAKQNFSPSSTLSKEKQIRVTSEINKVKQNVSIANSQIPEIPITSLKNRSMKISSNNTIDNINENIAHLPSRQLSQKTIAYAASGGTTG